MAIYHSPLKAHWKLSLKEMNLTPTKEVHPPLLIHQFTSLFLSALKSPMCVLISVLTNITFMITYFAALFSSNNRMAFQYILTAHFKQPWETVRALAFN